MDPQADIMIFLETPSGQEFSVSFGEDQQELFLQSKDLDAQDPRQTKYLYRILTRIKNRAGALNLRMKIQYRNDLNETRQEYPEVLNLSQTSDDHKIRTLGSKYFSFRIEDSPVVNSWKLSEMKFEGTVGGFRL